MGIKDLKDELVDEVATILASDFQIDVTNTTSVPHADDPGITFPNLDAKRQGSKLINTCVLYIDIRRSTQLSFSHRRETVAKLYSAFVRSMTRCARYHHGHVRGIIGDRVMVLFDTANAFTNAVECAISMNSVAKYVIDKHFKHNEVKCGIGIDAGNMLATKTGVRKRGKDQPAYRNLVWLGNPANVASKLTDLANKAADEFQLGMVHWAQTPGLFQIPGPGGWVWHKCTPSSFVAQLSVNHLTRTLAHSSPGFQSMFVQQEGVTLRPRTDPILMTEAVWNGFRASNPNSNVVTAGLFKEIAIKVPGHERKVFSGDVIYPIFKG